MYTFFFLSFFGTVQTLYNKNISLYKRFFFVFVLLFFFPRGMEVVDTGMVGEGLNLPSSLLSLWG